MGVVSQQLVVDATEGMALNLLQVEYPAPVVTIAETTTDEWTDDQCNGQGAGQDSVHLAVAGYGYNLKEKGRRKGHGARATDALEGSEYYAGVQEASVIMHATRKSKQEDGIGTTVSTHSSLMDLEAPQPAEKAMKRISELRSAVLRPM